MKKIKQHSNIAPNNLFQLLCQITRSAAKTPIITELYLQHAIISLVSVYTQLLRSQAFKKSSHRRPHFIAIFYIFKSKHLSQYSHKFYTKALCENSLKYITHQFKKYYLMILQNRRYVLLLGHEPLIFCYLHSKR